jgi:hypothetical protein
MSAAMPRLRRARFLQVMSLFLLVLQTQLYVLSQSCYRYVDPNDGTTKDLSGGLKGSMNEARLLAGLCKTFVTQAQLPNHIDNTRERI